MWVMVYWICVGSICSTADSGAFFFTKESCTQSLIEFKKGEDSNPLFATPMRGGACIKSDNVYAE